MGTLREAFGKILGTKLESRFPFYRVSLVTTLWTAETTTATTQGVAEEDHANQLARERELQDDWWKLLEVQGAMFRRHNNTMESAKEIVSSVIKVRLKHSRQPIKLTLTRLKFPSPSQYTYEISWLLGEIFYEFFHFQFFSRIYSIIGSTQAGKSSVCVMLPERYHWNN